MKRREFITLVGGTAALPLAARAQQVAGRSYSLGVLTGVGRDTPHVGAMFDELRRAGFIEGQNLVIIGGFGLRANEFSQQAVSIANSGIDAMYAGGDSGARAAQAATRTIPIVTISEDMVAAGLVHSLARPGGNTTGVSILSSNLNGKRQEIMIEAVPTARVIAVLADANIPITPSQLQALQEAMGHRGVDLVTYTFRTIDEIVPAIDAAKATGAAAINVLGSPLTSALAAGGQRVIDRTTALKLPSIYQFPERADEGGLIAYGPSRVEVWRQMARMLVKVLRGANPADLPVEQPTRFELVINLRTAKAIGIELPATLVLRADRVIE